jgi:serine/threonine protein kinase
VPVLSGGQDADGRAYLVMELMESGTLTEAIAIGRFGQRREILELMCKLARAVQHAHSRAVLHCDLKPENILFDSDGEPRIGDFGLSQDLDHGGSAARDLTDRMLHKARSYLGVPLLLGLGLFSALLVGGFCLPWRHVPRQTR